MSTQGRTSDQTEQTPQPDASTATQPTGDGTNLLHRWVRLVQQSALWGNEAGQVRLDELAQGPTTPRIQTLEEIRAARAAAIAEEEAEATGATSWWEDAICADHEAEAIPSEEVCETEPQLAELPPIFTLPPVVTPPTTVPPVPPALPVAAGEGLLARVLAFGARRVLPILASAWPKPTAPPELDEVPYAGPEGGVEPVGDGLPKDDNRCKAWKVDHLGGDEVHNQCADSIPGNAASGGDWFVTAPVSGAKNFDAYTPADATVWEVKTMGLGGYNPFVQGRELAKEVLAAKKDNKVAQECGYRYAWQVSDLAHYLEIEPMLAPLGIPVTYQPECLRKQEGDP